MEGVTLYCLFDCRILAHSKTVIRRMAWVAEKLHADNVHPWEYECRRCHCVWRDAVLADPQQVTCSNCYGDNIVISKVRLTFENWGEQNGGEREQRQRYETVLGMTGASGENKI
jgi:hypothetical protein